MCTFVQTIHDLVFESHAANTICKLVYIYTTCYT